MQRDIRDLFTAEEDLKSLPENHREEFLGKLQQQPKSTSTLFTWVKIVAVVITVITVGFGLINTYSDEEDISPMIAQIKAVEAEYLENIDVEWQRFIVLAKDEKLVDRFRKKLDELDSNYKDISIQFEEDANNILVVEALVENLQTRLQILKNIQNHIKILNQKNEQNENII
ncbi:hypothetical protein [uncultured Winogradskyella sp.]|uniref:hypothetical protein n=1 Tax=uncultured Winogradskyella sp. TaxID=395353 RepID=UPI0030DC5103|tara:strand:+ start:38793 stop:39308 length:516 start_codon:yes stop_codon:yes gene_type:complete